MIRAAGARLAFVTVPKIENIGWYCSGRPQAQAFRQSVMQAVSVETQLAQVRGYFDALEDSAAAVAA